MIDLKDGAWRQILIVLSVATLAATVQAQAPDLPPTPVAKATIQALAGSFPTQEAGRLQVALWFGITSKDLAAGPFEATARLLERGVEVEAFAVESTLDVETLEGRDRLQVYGDFSALPGTYTLALEIVAGPVSATARYPFTIELPEADRPSVMPPFFIDDEGAVAAFFETPVTLSSAGQGDAIEEGEPPADYPLVASGERFIPDISPRITEDIPRSRVCLIGRKLMDEKTFLETGLISQYGSMLSKERLAVISQESAAETGAPGSLETLCLGLDTQGLEAGTYQLNVTLHDFAQRSTESTEMPFEIVERASPEK